MNVYNKHREIERSNKNRNEKGQFKKGCISLNKIDLDEDLVVDLYENQGKSALKIGTQFRVHKNIIYRVLKDNNIPRRKGGVQKGSISPNKTQLDEELIVDLHNKGNSVSYISKRLGCNREIICRRLKEKGIKLIEDGSSWNKIKLDEDKIVDLYHNKKESVPNISHKFNCSNTPIYDILCRNNVPLRKGGFRINHNPHNKGKTKENYEPLKKVSENNTGEKNYSYGQISKNKNKTLEEIYDFKKSNQIKEKIKKARAKQIMPLKDSKIELKIQDFLTSLKIEFFTHKYMNIKHAYQCDILIPIQEGITQKIIIECDGDFFHMNPNKFSPEDKCFKNGIMAKEKWELDENRTKELIATGFKVLRLWENEIKEMNLNQFQIQLHNIQQLNNIGGL